MTAQLNPPSQRRKTRLNETASNTQVPEGVAPWGAAGENWWVVSSGWLELLSRERSGIFGCCVTFSVSQPPTPLILRRSHRFLLPSPDRHMAAIPALDSARHHALTLIGLIRLLFSLWPWRDFRYMEP